MRKFILNNGGTTADADDVIQDAIIICYEKIKNEEFKLQTTVIGYIYVVGKYTWYNKQRRERKFLRSPLDIVSEENIEEIEFELFNIEKTVIVEELLEQIGASCKKILIESIYKKIPMREIAMLNNLKNEQVARNKKSKCLQGLRKVVSNSTYFKKVFKYIEI